MTNLLSLNVAELRKLAIKYNINGRNKMRRKELLEEIKKKEDEKENIKENEKGDIKKLEKKEDDIKKDIKEDIKEDIKDDTTLEIKEYYIDGFRLMQEEIDYALLEVIKNSVFGWNSPNEILIDKMLRILCIFAIYDQIKLDYIIKTSLLRLEKNLQHNNIKNINELNREQFRLYSESTDKLNAILKKIRKNIRILEKENDEKMLLWKKYRTPEGLLKKDKKITEKYNKLLHKIKRKKQGNNVQEDTKLWEHFLKLMKKEGNNKS